MAVRVARAPQQFSRHAAEQLDEKNSKCRVVTPHILTYFSQLLRVTEKKRRSEKTDSIEDRSDVYIKMSLSYIPVKTSVIWLQHCMLANFTKHLACDGRWTICFMIERSRWQLRRAFKPCSDKYAHRAPKQAQFYSWKRLWATAVLIDCSATSKVDAMMNEKKIRLGCSAASKSPNGANPPLQNIPRQFCGNFHGFDYTLEWTEYATS